jgi:hypothetical protein
MMPSSMHKQEDARVEKKDGTVVGPYKMVFAGTIIVVWDAQADIEEGDAVLRKLPNGREERSEVTEVTFYDTGHMQPHYQLKFNKGALKEMAKPSNTFNIHGGQVQIGDHNTQNIVNALRELQERIDSTDGAPEQKQEAKGILNTLLTHPLVITVLGAAVKEVLK